MIESLPRRERELFELLCSLGEGSAATLRAAMTDPPSDSAVRTLLSRLEAKGLIGHRIDNQTYIYAPAQPAGNVAATAMQRLVHTFFGGSAVRAATALLGSEDPLTAQEIETLQALIDQAKERSQ
ncbi:MAG: BlaI/MecI/CopY family transcriptional regulator [Asticcacaulis sp.]